MLRIDRITKK